MLELATVVVESYTLPATVIPVTLNGAGVTVKAVALDGAATNE